MYYTRALAVMRALIGGLGDVLRAPAIIIASVVAMLIIAIPFGAALGVRLQQSLTSQQPVAEQSTEIDADWWQEFIEHADGIAATFTPAILGFAAPLDNLSSLLDGTHRPLILMAPIGIAMVTWAFLWGAALDRFARGRQAGALWRAGVRTLAPFTAISLLAAVVVIALYYSVHALLFGIVADRMQTWWAEERSLVAGRLLLYLVFGSLLIAVGLVADYARVHLALSPDDTVAESVRAAGRFVRAHTGAALGLYLATGALLVVLLAVYGGLEIAGGSSVGGWRGIAIGQAYIIARIVIRLTFGASELRLYRLRGHRQTS
jgi:hypothetical protein